MVISQLIKHLEKIKKESGDLVVAIDEPKYGIYREVAGSEIETPTNFYYLQMSRGTKVHAGKFLCIG